MYTYYIDKLHKYISIYIYTYTLQLYLYIYICIHMCIQHRCNYSHTASTPRPGARGTRGALELPSALARGAVALRPAAAQGAVQRSGAAGAGEGRGAGSFDGRGVATWAQGLRFF